MRNKFLITSIVAGAIAGTILTISSCSKKLDEVYLNPNNPTVVPIEQLLPNVLANLTATALPPAGGGGGSYGPSSDGTLVGRYIQYWNFVTSGDTYDQMGGPAPGSTDNLGAIWAGHYYGIGQNGMMIIKWGTEQKKWDYVGVAHAIFAWSWLTLTEQHGEVILRDAFNTSLQQFKYDQQQDVYDTVRVIARKAIEYLNMTGDNVSQQNLAKGDGYFYNGDVAKWKKFTYGVLARSYAHLSNKSIYTANHYADSVIKYCDLSLQTNDDNATQKFKPAGTSGTQSWWGPFRANAGSIRQSAYIANLMSGVAPNSPWTGVTDPRIAYLLRENTNGTYKGVVPNLGSSSLSTADQPRNFWGQSFAVTASAQDTAGRFIFRNDADLPVMTAAEIQFMKAEAAFRNGNKSLALSAYKQGISLNIDMLMNNYGFRVPASKLITTTTKNDYLNNPKVVPTDPNQLTLTHIMLQKYIALYGYGAIETWTDMRRYHYLDIDPATGKQVYADFTLPATIYSYNLGKPVYRARPRYNSEYLYNVPNLQTIGALAPEYNTIQPWFVIPQ